MLRGEAVPWRAPCSWPKATDLSPPFGCCRRVLSDGETVSATGTHLGHNLPDRSGNRYCINLVSIAGRPVAGPTAKL